MKLSRAEELRRWRAYLEDANRSYQIMCEAHQQLVERERIHVWDEAELKNALYAIVQQSKDEASKVIAAKALGIKHVVPFPKKTAKGRK